MLGCRFPGDRGTGTRVRNGEGVTRVAITSELRRRHPRRHHGRSPGQRADRAGLVRRGRRAGRGERGPGDQGRGAARRGARLQRRRGHQGDAAHQRLRGADRRQQGLLRGVQGGLRVRGPGDRRRQRLLPRRRGRAGRQRGLHRGQRRRLLRRARGRPRRARRRHAPGPAGAAAPDADALLHRPHDHRAAAGPARQRARGGAARRARRGGAHGGRRDRAPRTPG